MSDVAGRDAPKPLAWGPVIGIGVGDFGFNIYWQTASLYLLFFYTDVLGIPAAEAGAVYMLALIWDGALDPIIGLAADRTRSRFGRYRPYLLFGGVPLALCFVALFVVPHHGNPLCLPVLIATQLLFRTLYAAISVPYAALSARVTLSHQDRSNLSAARMVFAILGALVVSVAMLPAAAALRGAGGATRGWQMTALLLGIVATLCLLFVAASTRSLDRADPQAAKPMRVSAKLAAARDNRAMMLVIGAIAVSSFSGTIFQKGLVYYLKYAVGQPKLIGIVLGGMALLAALSVPFWALIAKRFGKRTTWLVGLIPSVLGVSLWYCAPTHELRLVVPALAVMALGAGASAFCFWAMVPDTVEYGEWLSGVRSESLVFGLVVLAQKVALGLGAGALGLLLTRLGYVADTAQGTAAMGPLKMAMVAASLSGSICVAALVWYYPITAARHSEIVTAIRDRVLQEKE